MCLVPYGFRVELTGTSVCLNFANWERAFRLHFLGGWGGERLPGLWVIWALFLWITHCYQCHFLTGLGDHTTLGNLSSYSSICHLPVSVVVTKCCYEGPDSEYFRWGLHFCSLCCVECTLHKPAAPSHFPHVPRRHSLTSRAFCHFKDDCCLCLVGRGQRSFSVSCGALHSPQNKWCQTPKHQYVSGQDRTGHHCVSIIYSQKQTAGHIEPVGCLPTWFK